MGTRTLREWLRGSPEIDPSGWFRGFLGKRQAANNKRAHGGQSRLRGRAHASRMSAQGGSHAKALHSGFVFWLYFKRIAAVREMSWMAAEMKLRMRTLSQAGDKLLEAGGRGSQGGWQM